MFKSSYIFHDGLTIINSPSININYNKHKQFNVRESPVNQEQAMITKPTRAKPILEGTWVHHEIGVKSR